jgi:Dolichyl-phosphate-mannose-protein mannosyltransferase
MTKYTMAFFAVALLGAMLLAPNRRYFRSAWFWCGVALALLIVAPNLWWQYQHHFVGLTWMRSIHTRDIGLGRTDNFLLKQFWSATNPAAVPLWLAGLWFLFARPAGRRWRMLGWMYVLTLGAPDGRARTRLLPCPGLPDAVRRWCGMDRNLAPVAPGAKADPNPARSMDNARNRRPGPSRAHAPLCSCQFAVVARAGPNIPSAQHGDWLAGTRCHRRSCARFHPRLRSHCPRSHGRGRRRSRSCQSLRFTVEPTACPAPSAA